MQLLNEPDDLAGGTTSRVRQKMSINIRELPSVTIGMIGWQ